MNFQTKEVRVHVSTTFKMSPKRIFIWQLAIKNIIGG